MHKFKTSGKVYIGQTCKGVFFRLKVHVNDAIRDPKTKFHKAILKYGIEDIETSVLDKVGSKEESDKLEIFYIEKFDSFKNGYNMTLGGDGGDIFNLKSEDEKARIKGLFSINSTGVNNPRYCGLSDDELVEIAFKYFLDNDYKITRNGWFYYCKLNNLPQNYSEFRFNGNKYNGLIEKLKIKLTENNISYNEYSFTFDKYKRYKSNKYSYLENIKFGDYIIKSESFTIENKSGFVLCRCDCGQLKTFEAANLIKKQYKCNCKKGKNVKNNKTAK